MPNERLKNLEMVGGWVKFVETKPPTMKTERLFVNYLPGFISWKSFKIIFSSWVIGILTLLVFCLLPFAAAAQKKQEVAAYEVWIRNEQKHSVTHGYLQQLSDSTLTMIPIWHYRSKSIKVFPVEHVQWVQVRKKGSLGKGIAWGAAIGLVTGFVLGYLDGPDPPCEPNTWCFMNYNSSEKGILYSTLTVPVGMIIGGAIGGVKTKITIKGSQSAYARQREQLEKYRYSY